MDSNYIKLHLTVDRYLRGSLDDDEKAAFEERMLWDEELVNEVDLADRLKEGLQAIAARPSAEPMKTGFLDWMSSVLLVPQYAAAASFLLAAILTTAVFMSPIVGDNDSVDMYTAQTEIIPLLVTRGTDRQTISVAAGNWAVLLVDVIGGFDAFRVSVRRGEFAEPVWTKDGLTPTYPEAIAVGMPGRVLEPGDYALELYGVRLSESAVGGYEHIQNIPFTVAPEN